MDASPDLAWPCASSEKASKTEGPSWDDGSIAWAAGRGREGRVRGRAWRNPLGGQLARTSLGRMVRSKNEDVFVASYLHDEQAIFSGGPTTGPPSLLTSKSSTSEHTGHVIGTASIGRRAVRRDDEATARLRPLRATRYGRRETHAAALRSTRPPLPSTFAILLLRPLHAWLASRSVKQDSQSCLSSELEPFLSEKAGCPGGQGSFRRTRMRGVRARALVARQRGGMLALIGPRRLARRCLPPSFDRNPQNVPDSDVRPSPDMAPEEVSEGPALSRPSCAPSPGDTDESSSILVPPEGRRGAAGGPADPARAQDQPRYPGDVRVLRGFRLDGAVEVLRVQQRSLPLW